MTARRATSHSPSDPRPSADFSPGGPRSLPLSMAFAHGAKGGEASLSPQSGKARLAPPLSVRPLRGRREFRASTSLEIPPPRRARNPRLVDGQRNLALVGNIPHAEFYRQSLFINGLERPRTQSPMDLDAGADRVVGELIQAQVRFGQIAVTATFHTWSSAATTTKLPSTSATTPGAPSAAWRFNPLVTLALPLAHSRRLGALRGLAVQSFPATKARRSPHPCLTFKIDGATYRDRL